MSDFPNGNFIKLLPTESEVGAKPTIALYANHDSKCLLAIGSNGKFISMSDGAALGIAESRLEPRSSKIGKGAILVGDNRFSFMLDDKCTRRVVLDKLVEKKYKPQSYHRFLTPSLVFSIKDDKSILSILATVISCFPLITFGLNIRAPAVHTHVTLTMVRLTEQVISENQDKFIRTWMPLIKMYHPSAEIWSLPDCKFMISCDDQVYLLKRDGQVYQLPSSETYGVAKPVIKVPKSSPMANAILRKMEHDSAHDIDEVVGNVLDVIYDRYVEMFK